MSDHYYAQEETTAVDTVDNALASWHSQAEQLVNAAAASDSALAETEQALGALYQQADAAGDEPAKAHIVAAWQRAQQLNATVKHMDATIAGAAETIRKLDEQRSQVIAELASLTEALEEGNSNDPRLYDFAEMIAEDATEYAEMWADEIAFDSLYESVTDTFRANGIDHDDALNVFEALRGDIDLTPAQRAQLQHFAHSLRAPEGGEQS